MAKVSWFLAGIGMGTAVGLLYAPHSGEQTRQVLRVKAEEGRDYLRDRAGRAREQANEWVERGREALTEQKENVRAAYKTGRQAYQEATTPKTGTS
ncbi:MAG TPA: YtxH domain-containing protein [Terriglobales bacterium]|nr:YtxH domain-containing protein [Terriglobales bacterium]